MQFVPKLKFELSVAFFPLTNKMASKRFLNVSYENQPARIDTKDMEDISQLQKGVEEWYSKDFSQVTALKVQLWNKNASGNKQIKTWSQLRGLSYAYFAEEDGLCLTVQLVPSPSRQPTSTALLLTAPTKRPLVSDQEIADQVKKRRLSISKNLVDTSGADFLYSDRNESFKVLADCLEKRHSSWKQGKKDRNLHPIPFLADGPGSGKSRFLQELPSSFVDFVPVGSYSEEFKMTLKSPVCINITFSNGSPYSLMEANAINIEQSVCLRILYQFETGYSNFASFYDSHKSQEFSLSAVLLNVGDGASCIILGIDEVNKVYEIGVHKQKELGDVNERLLSGLFGLIGGLSCEFLHFFVPVLAGTVIGPMKSVVRKSTHPPLHIPLPLLSFESCLKIFEKKNTKFSQLVKTSHQLRRLISDCGGHCRSLEILFDGMVKFHVTSSNPLMDDVSAFVRHTLHDRYELSGFPLGAAIALSFLRKPVKPIDKYPEQKSLTFQDLEEKGVIKLEEGLIRMPYFFACSFILGSETTEYSKFWSTLLLEKRNFLWQDWELFNRNYIAFRLSLFAYLGEKTIPLKKFFAGAKMNIPVDIDINIPPLAAIKVSKIDCRYPLTNASNFEIGDHVLNAAGAPFDSFLYLESNNGRLLLAFQMKLANQDSQTKQVITNNSVNVEFNKINNVVQECLPGTDFICIILGRCDGKFDENQLPSKCAVVSREEQMEFYGESYYHQLNCS